MENLDLLKFYHLNYIPCNCNNCPFPMIIKFNKKQIFTSCIKKHKSIYNSLKIILLKKNYGKKNRLKYFHYQKCVVNYPKIFLFHVDI